MVQKAVDARPQSGAMLDSLGWAYFRLGDYKKAVEKLEDGRRAGTWRSGRQRPPGRRLLARGTAHRGPVPVAAGAEPGARATSRRPTAEAKLKDGLGASGAAAVVDHRP
jgi:predicted Zn-dependent protease